MDEVAQHLVERFGMQPHPEGGYYREVFRSAIELENPAAGAAATKVRSACSQIYFLLAKGQFSAFHRVRSGDEIWHLYSGGPLELHVIDAHGNYTLQTLAMAMARGQPTGIVPAGCWQAARLSPSAPWVLVGCTVAPGFDFEDFEMPSAEQLIAMHPEHATIVRALTRS